ncbi:hypothetical protein [Neptuniibacter sp. QD37_11]|uniref:hypothetical protein n=1 Tax=Neptuniibacter sp. QD37_11 TaxID=3398209 RepID=UPI0039F617DC
MSKIPAEHFVNQIAHNVNNEQLSDAEFRTFIRNTLDIVIFEDTRIPQNEDSREQLKSSLTN